MKYLLILCLTFSMLACKHKKNQLMEEQYLIHQNYDLRIAFGSCSNQDRKQILWDEILNENPDAWIWLGDNIYGDSEDMNILRQKYNKQKSNEEYQKLIATAAVHGVWDDHDYGVNDGGKHYPAKDASQKELLDFFDVPDDDPRRKQSGTYYSTDIKKQGIKVKLICLDTRYFRDDPIRNGNNYDPNTEGTILGKTQWEWLERECDNSEADVNIIATSIQAIPEDHRFEKWKNFPNERARLFNLITDSKLKNPILISGDRHIGEISKIDWKKDEIYEITSSSLTHGWSKKREELNQHRIGKIAYLENYGILEFRKKGKELQINARLMAQNSQILNELKLN